MFKSIIPIAALVACSGAWAEFDDEYWETLRKCSGLYIRGDLESDSDMDGYQRIANVAQNELEKLDKEDSYWAGYFFAREEAFTESHYAPERIYHYDKADQTEAHRLKSIIELGCERLQIIQSSRR